MEQYTTGTAVTMKLSALVLLALLGLASASLQDIVRRSSRHRRELLSEDNVNLEWLTWTGSRPNGAVSIYNSYAKRTDYVCQSGCSAGFYNPNLGSHCHYAYGNKEYKARQFKILVNKDNFEFLEWKADSYGSVPPNSIKTCPGGDGYVGKNQYGLGKVSPRNEAFFLPWEGSEHWYKSYEVLTINRDGYRQKISNVKYLIDDVQIFKEPLETLTTSILTNNGCQNVGKTVNLEKTTVKESTWNIGRSTTLGVTSTITAGIPTISSATIAINLEETLMFSSGMTRREELKNSLSVQLTVPPNHSCTARMEGRTSTADIPYTARLSRTYRNGETQWTSITGTYKGVQIGEVRAVIDRCEPVADAEPCP